MILQNKCTKYNKFLTKMWPNNSFLHCDLSTYLCIYLKLWKHCIYVPPHTHILFQPSLSQWEREMHFGISFVDFIRINYAYVKYIVYNSFHPARYTVEGHLGTTGIQVRPIFKNIIFRFIFGNIFKVNNRGE